MLSRDLSGLGDRSPHLWQGELEPHRESPFPPLLIQGPLRSLGAVEGWRQKWEGGNWQQNVPLGLHAFPGIGEESFVPSTKTYQAVAMWQALF